MMDVHLTAAQQSASQAPKDGALPLRSVVSLYKPGLPSIVHGAGVVRHADSFGVATQRFRHNVFEVKASLGQKSRVTEIERGGTVPRARRSMRSHVTIHTCQLLAMTREQCKVSWYFASTVDALWKEIAAW